MTSERKINWNEKTQLLEVEAVTKDAFSKEQVKNIYLDLEAKLKNASDMLLQFKDLKFALIKVGKEPRLKDIVETILTITKLGKLPDLESIDKTIKYYKEQKESLEKDINLLKPVYEKKV